MISNPEKKPQHPVAKAGAEYTFPAILAFVSGAVLSMFVTGMAGMGAGFSLLINTAVGLIAAGFTVFRVMRASAGARSRIRLVFTNLALLSLGMLFGGATGGHVYALATGVNDHWLGYALGAATGMAFAMLLVRRIK